MRNARDCRWRRAESRGDVTYVAPLSRIVCLALVLTQVGCRSVYRLHCTSRPMLAGVVVGEEMLGETPCDVSIPEDSDWIQDGKIELRFCLPDGREKTHAVDLHGLKASNPFAEIVSTPLVVVGMGILLVSGNLNDDDEDDEDDYRHLSREEERERHKEQRRRFNLGLVGAGFAGAGAGLHRLLGGDSDSLTPYDVHVRFEEPPDEAAQDEGGI